MFLIMLCKSKVWQASLASSAWLLTQAFFWKLVRNLHEFELFISAASEARNTLQHHHINVLMKETINSWHSESIYTPMEMKSKILIPPFFRSFSVFNTMTSSRLEKNSKCHKSRFVLWAQHKLGALNHFRMTWPFLIEMRWFVLAAILRSDYFSKKKIGLPVI